MKKLFIIACLLMTCIPIGVLMAQNGKEVFVDQIDFKLDRISANAYENEYFMTLKMNKGTSYAIQGDEQSGQPAGAGCD